MTSCVHAVASVAEWSAISVLTKMVPGPHCRQILLNLLFLLDFGFVLAPRRKREVLSVIGWNAGRGIHWQLLAVMPISADSSMLLATGQ